MKGFEQNPHNKNLKIIIAISMACYILTAVLPVISLGFIVYYEAMIYEILDSLGLAFFFGSLVSVLMAIITFSNHISFRIFAFLATALSILPLIYMFDVTGYFAELNAGFYTYLGGALTSLVAGIIYKNPKQPTKPLLQTILDTQDMQKNISPDEKVMFLEYPEENVQTLSFQERTSEENVQLNRETCFCGNCGGQINKTSSFCEHCGFDLSEK